MAKRFLVLCILVAVATANSFKDDEDRRYHSRHFSGRATINPAEKEPAFWNEKAQAVVQQHREMYREGVAKNVIFFLGDGMSIPTLAAARTYMGQKDGNTGEESQLAFEKFPVTGLTKTYCVDTQVADSACSATAYLCGVKANYATIGVSAKVEQNDCDKMTDPAHHVHSIAKKFLDDERSAGLVTTTRVTHASAAGLYAHTAQRDWENDNEVRKDGGDPEKCKDIAQQLIFGEVGKRLKVILGGGRREFLNSTVRDEEGYLGRRTDGKNLIEEWKKEKDDAVYVWNREQLLQSYENNMVLGLFESSHCQYNLRRNTTTEPSLEEMVEVAIKVLSRNEKGYFLFVEGGRIDHAHHDNLANLALDETVEFSKAVDKAKNMTSREDTLIVVTSDHSHLMTFNGYPDRGNPILSHVGYNADDGKPYMTLSYANGRGYRKEDANGRIDVTKEEDYGKDGFISPAMVFQHSETHGGDDVGVFALGPWQQMFTGLYEQSTIPHLIEFIACLDPNKTVCSSDSTSTRVERKMESLEFEMV